MRNAIDIILVFIGTSTLTDIEFSTFTESIYSDQELYVAILSLLETRGEYISTINRLYYYFLAQGVDVEAPDTAKSNIFIGAPLNEI